MFSGHNATLICLTLLSKYPLFVHAGDEEDGRLGETHEEVCHRQINDEDV